MTSLNIAEEKKDFAQKFISYLPLLTLLALGTCIINELVYYYPFHLDILTYMDINEIVLNTLNGLIGCTITFIIPQITFYILEQTFTYYKIRKLGIIDRNDERLVLRLSFKKINLIVITGISILTILLIIVLIRIDNKKLQFNQSVRQYNKEVQLLNEGIQKTNQYNQKKNSCMYCLKLHNCYRGKMTHQHRCQ